jgi:hypothetical protein
VPTQSALSYAKSMDHHILCPTLDALKDNMLDLSNLVDGVVKLFDNADVVATELGQATCAAKVYLAIIYAFEKKGFTQIAHAPDLWLDVGSGVYEVKLASRPESSHNAYPSCIDFAVWPRPELYAVPLLKQ